MTRDRYSYGTKRAKLVTAARVDHTPLPPAPRMPPGTLQAVPCPDCDAPPNARCVSPQGEPRTTVHIARRRKAVRKYMADREAEAAIEL